MYTIALLFQFIHMYATTKIMVFIDISECFVLFIAVAIEELSSSLRSYNQNVHKIVNE